MRMNFKRLALAGGMLIGMFFAGCATVAPEPAPKIELQQSEHYSGISGDYCTVSEVDQPPRPRLTVPPVYPSSLMNRGVSGYAVLVAVIEADGRISECLIKTATKPAFGDAARQAVLKWKYSPALKNGVPVRCATEVPVTFQVGNMD